MKFKHVPILNPKLRTHGLASVTSATFGMVRNNGTRAHQGVDLASPVGYRLYAVEDGVVSIGNQPDGHGLFVAIKIQSENKTIDGLFAFYSHLSRIDVKNGQGVKAGQVIGLTGDTGNAKGMTTIERGGHLHFELRTQLIAGLGLNNRIDPLPFITLAS